MLFNSYAFLVFLAFALAGYELLRARFSHTSCLLFLAACSLFFYGFWNPAYLALILGSILFNYALGRAIHRRLRQPSAFSPGAILAMGIAGNLSLLAYFKYLGLFAEVVPIKRRHPGPTRSLGN